MKAINILWDEDDALEVRPNEVEIPKGITDVDDISDWLSGEFGFHYGFGLLDDDGNEVEDYQKGIEEMKAINVLWNVDEDEEEVLEMLPNEVHIPDGMTDTEEISDWLSDEYEFCHAGFELVEDQKGTEK